MNLQQVYDDLYAVSELLHSPSKWTKYTFRNENNSLCLVGAVLQATEVKDMIGSLYPFAENERVYMTLNFLLEAVRENFPDRIINTAENFFSKLFVTRQELAYWNNHASTTFEDIRKVIDTALENVRKMQLKQFYDLLAFSDNEHETCELS